MLVLGIAGGIDLIYQNRDFLVPDGELHDSAAAIVEDGKIIAAIEEERLNRIKHTNKGPVSAIRFCLDSCGARLSDIDRLIVAGDERLLAKYIRYRDLHQIDMTPISDPRGLTHELLIEGLGQDIDDNKISFIRHHSAHAISSCALSGFSDSLVLTLDGAGDDISGQVLLASPSSLLPLHSFPIPFSIGLFYLKVIEFLGFRLFDEYKVMGLAPYGDPSRFRSLFSNFFQLLPDGNYSLSIDLPDDLAPICPPRKSFDPILQLHIDIAAALQDAVESIAFHILSHFKALTLLDSLCLAGGVAQNCSLNGKLLASGLFKRIFVQPASYDAGLVLGAALSPFFLQPQPSARPIAALEHVFLGPDIGPSQAVSSCLSPWGKFLDFSAVENISRTAARLLAEGSVIGWMQGRSEFGPRALGNRSILADPRPPSNKDLINSMVKKREAYRPFAPAVIEEAASDFFDLPAGATSFPFMTFVVKVREDKRALLGATTHVDGTARLQTVSKQTNPRFWGLINEFGEQTGVPVLLNTSFNNNVEPIVETVNDGVVTFLTTKLDYLVVGDYLVSKKEVEQEQYLGLEVRMPKHTRLEHKKGYVNSEEMGDEYSIGSAVSKRYEVKVSERAYRVLMGAGGGKGRGLGELMESEGVKQEERREVIEEMIELWRRRAVELRPPLPSV